MKQVWTEPQPNEASKSAKSMTNPQTLPDSNSPVSELNEKSAQPQDPLVRLISDLSEIRAEMLELEGDELACLQNLHPLHNESARNLLHYLALRRHDLESIQERLALHGLSSLGRAEAHVKANVDAIAAVLQRLSGAEDEALVSTQEQSLSYGQGVALLAQHTEALLGPKPAERTVRIMVTMPTEAAQNYELVRDLLLSGMDCMRINCAHDDAASWALMIDNLHRAIGETGKTCRILMDLPGPKLRTGPIEPGPKVVKWRPRRDAYGSVKKPARIWLTPEDHREVSSVTSDVDLPVSGTWLNYLKVGDMIKFFDARGASRSFRLVERIGNSWWAESFQTTYMSAGTLLHVMRDGAPSRDLIDGRVGELPPSEQWIQLTAGQSLILTRELKPGRPAVFDRKGRLESPPCIGITLPEVFEYVRPGEKIWLDDGLIGGIIKSVGKDQIEVMITHTRPTGSKLRADKGVNLPESDLKLPALTDVDLQHLDFIARNADLVGYSFVRKAKDVYELQEHLARLHAEHLGVVLKIETSRAFEELPNLLLTLMRSPCAGVMIARGDLAVECGWERMAEVQEEILWICEAAHMPVIWATQVLEKLTKEGVPSRAEITDAAMSERAECVMLNKGPYVVEAVRTLDDILRRMQRHQQKKRSMLRHLRLADHLI